MTRPSLSWSLFLGRGVETLDSAGTGARHLVWMLRPPSQRRSATVGHRQPQWRLRSVAPTGAQELLLTRRRWLAGPATRPCAWALSVLESPFL